MDETGQPGDAVLAALDEQRAAEPDPHGGSLFGLVYPSGDHDLENFIVEVNNRYLFGNALNPFRYPSLATMEAEVVASVGELVHLPAGGGGSMTSGGTESILMSMLVSRERARARGVERPQLLVPHSAHPAYAKAAHYFDMDVVKIPLRDDLRADVDAAAGLIDERTAVVVASSFSYPYGIMDPIEDLAGLAHAHGVGCHVDACIGGFVLPFVEQLGRPVPPWDFGVEGVTEMSVDIHKYGYVPKGASVVLHRDEDWRDLQWFLFGDWPSGIYGSPAVAGARPAAPIAVAWAVLRHLGQAGYRSIVGSLMDTVDRVRAGVEAIDGLTVLGDPVGPVFAIVATDADLDVFAVAEAVDAAGWHVNRNTEPRSIHLMLSPAHGPFADQLLADLGAAVAQVRAAGSDGSGGHDPVRYS
ncbi:MAG TPA: aminotransferase class V-fold PLP-dependent enzyme [Acidimicrobiales bacterium]